MANYVPWVVQQAEASIRLIDYENHGLHLQAGVGQQVVVASGQDHQEQGVIYQIQNEGDQPMFYVTLRNGSSRRLRVFEIYWVRRPGTDYCVPAASLFEINSEHGVRKAEILSGLQST